MQQETRWHANPLFRSFCSQLYLTTIHRCLCRGEIPNGMLVEPQASQYGTDRQGTFRPSRLPERCQRSGSKTLLLVVLCCRNPLPSLPNCERQSVLEKSGELSGRSCYDL